MLGLGTGSSSSGALLLVLAGLTLGDTGLGVPLLVLGTGSSEALLLVTLLELEEASLVPFLVTLTLMTLAST